MLAREGLRQWEGKLDDVCAALHQADAPELEEDAVDRYPQDSWLGEVWALGMIRRRPRNRGGSSVLDQF